MFWIIVFVVLFIFKITRLGDFAHLWPKEKCVFQVTPRILGILFTRVILTVTWRYNQDRWVSDVNRVFKPYLLKPLKFTLKFT